MNPLILWWCVHVLLIGTGLYKDAHAEQSESYTCSFYCVTDPLKPCITIKIKDATVEEAQNERLRIIDSLNREGTVIESSKCFQDK